MLTAKLSDWPQPFENYDLFDGGCRIGWIGRNTELETNFTVQVFKASELASNWANVKRPQPIYIGSFATVADCVAGATSFLADQLTRSFA
jgi:hypothetical protein